MLRSPGIMLRPFLFSRSCKESGYSKSESVMFYSNRFGLEGDQREDKSFYGIQEEMRRPEGDRFLGESCSWASMPLDLMVDIMQRVEASVNKWPELRSIVFCSCVCKQWREATLKVVNTALVCHPGKISLPSSLKQPGPLDSIVHCLVKRDKKNQSFYLYLALMPSLTDKGKFLLAAQRHKNGSHKEYIISLDADDLSPGSKSYVGKLRSDFLGTKFVIYDSQPPHTGAKPSSSRSDWRFANKQISPQVPASNFKVGTVSYKFNLRKSKVPRRMMCSIKSPSSEEVYAPKIKDLKFSSHGYTVLKNKAPRWHNNVQCWCLNFNGRVTMASVKNFQLVEAIDPCKQCSWIDKNKTVLQFGKVGDDTFSMDYRHPLSAFQAFAISLTSFGSKLACE